MVFKKTDLGDRLGMKNEPRQIQDAGLHCVPPNLPKIIILHTVYYKTWKRIGVIAGNYA
jgi:hypothetical protein